MLQFGCYHGIAENMQSSKGSMLVSPVKCIKVIDFACDFEPNMGMGVSRFMGIDPNVRSVLLLEWVSSTSNVDHFQDDLSCHWCMFIRQTIPILHDLHGSIKAILKGLH
jgi:hypothetical protein